MPLGPGLFSSASSCNTSGFDSALPDAETRGSPTPRSCDDADMDSEGAGQRLGHASRRHRMGSGSLPLASELRSAELRISAALEENETRVRSLTSDLDKRVSSALADNQAACLGRSEEAARQVASE